MRSSPRWSSRSKPRSRGGAKQLYGVRPARPSPGERTATMSQVAPQKPLRAVRRLVKATGSISSRSDGCRPRASRESRPGQVGVRSASRVVPVSARLGVRAASCGRWFNGFAMVDASLIRDTFVTGSAARGPIKNRRGRDFDAREPVRDRCPRSSSSGNPHAEREGYLAFALACPSSADSSPRRAGGRISESAWVHWLSSSVSVAGGWLHQRIQIH